MGSMSPIVRSVSIFTRARRVLGWPRRMYGAAARDKAKLRRDIFMDSSLSLHLQDRDGIRRKRAAETRSQAFRARGHRHNLRWLGNGIGILRAARAHRHGLPLGVHACQAAHLDAYR